MECSFFIILCTLLVVDVQSDHSRVVDLITKSVEKISQNVFYLIVDCEDYNLRRTIDTWEEVQKKVSKSHVNVIVEPFSPKAGRPSIFAKTFTQLHDALENHACDGKISYQGWEWSARIQSIIKRTKEQAHSQDAIFVFTSSRPEEWREIIQEKGMPLNIIWTGSISVPEMLKNMPSQTNNQILADSNGQVLRIEKITEKHSMKLNDTLKYRHSTMMHALNGNTRTELQIPDQAFRMFLTIRGKVQKALLVPPSGLVINITPERSQNLNNQASEIDLQNYNIFYDTPAVRGLEKWTLVADGSQYNMSMLTLLAKKDMEDEPVLQNRNDKIPFNEFNANEEKSMHPRDTYPVAQPSENAAALVKRLGFGLPPPFIKGQRPKVRPDQLGPGYLTKIDVDVQSTLYAFPGENVQVIFKVQNNKPMPYSYDFDCIYQQQPCFVQPEFVLIHPQQRALVTVRVRAEGSDGSSSVLTFMSQSMDYEEKRVYIYVGKQKSDSRSPDIDYEYNGNCDDANTGGTCHQKKWSANLWAQDSDSGLLNFWSEPPGLIYTSEFIVGTRDRVSARYSASCCNPKADILASDLRGNTYKIILNIERIHFSALEITAMVLGVILIIILIVGIIYGIIRWRRRRKERLFLG